MKEQRQETNKIDDLSSKDASLQDAEAYGEGNQEETWLQKVQESLPGLRMSKWRLRPPIRRSRYIFTDNKHPWRGIFSTLLGLFAFVLLTGAIDLAYQGGGRAGARSVAAFLLAVVFAIGGELFGILSRLEQDIYPLFPNLGIALNAVVIAGEIGMILLGQLMH